MQLIMNRFDQQYVVLVFKNFSKVDDTLTFDTLLLLTTDWDVAH